MVQEVVMASDNKVGDNSFYAHSCMRLEPVLR